MTRPGGIGVVGVTVIPISGKIGINIYFKKLFKTPPLIRFVDYSLVLRPLYVSSKPFDCVAMFNFWLLDESHSLVGRIGNVRPRVPLKYSLTYQSRNDS